VNVRRCPFSVHSDAGGLVKRVVELFVNGDLSLFGQDEEQSLPSFRPLAVRLVQSVDTIYSTVSKQV